MLEEAVRAIAAAAPGTLAGIVMLVICFRHIAGERDAREKLAEDERKTRAAMAEACHAHQTAIVNEVKGTIQANTTAVLRCAEMHGAVTVALERAGVAPPAAPSSAPSA